VTQHERFASAGVAASLTALLLAAPPPRVALASLAGAGSSADPTGPLVAAIALLAWAGTGWLALTVAVVLLSRVPGLVGRAGRAVAGRVAPAAVRRTVEAALGLTVAVGTLAPSAALAASVGGPAADVGVAWDLDWPSRSAAPPSTSGGPTAAGPTAGPGSTSAPSVPPPGPVPPSPTPPSPAPSASAPSSSAPPAVPSTTVRPSAVAPSAVAPSAVAPSAVARTANAVVVRPGDSLWALAEASLRSSGTADPTDRQVAQAWPLWWAANREVVGDDPDLLLPGTVLRPPPGSTTTP
jgi:hypothetical protein